MNPPSHLAHSENSAGLVLGMVAAVVAAVFGAMASVRIDPSATPPAVAQVDRGARQPVAVPAPRPDAVADPTH